MTRFRVYYASSLANHDLILSLEAEGVRQGFAPSYSWATDYLAELTRTDPLSFPEKVGIADKCVQGVRDCDVLVLVVPAKRGAHIEYGVAVGAGKPVVVWSRDPSDDIGFYGAAGAAIVRTRDEIFDAVRAAINRVNYNSPARPEPPLTVRDER